jgi:hypothetical protein
MMPIVYAFVAVVLLGAGVSTCNYVQRVQAEAEMAAFEAQTAQAAQQQAEAALVASEENAKVNNELAAKAQKAERDLAWRLAKLREELSHAKQQPVPAGCVKACDDHFRPVRDVLVGIVGLSPQANPADGGSAAKAP